MLYRKIRVGPIFDQDEMNAEISGLDPSHIQVWYSNQNGWTRLNETCLEIAANPEPSYSSSA